MAVDNGQLRTEGPHGTARGNKIEVIDLGVKGYGEVLELQHELWEQRREGTIGDKALIVEHPAVITLGARKSANKLLEGEDKLRQAGVEIVNIRRGGGATAHNPGQVVFYPIIDLHARGLGVNEYIRELEEIGIELLAGLGVTAKRKEGFPGLWVESGRKIASIGVRVSKGVTYHGMAINICNELSIFDAMVPCGLDGVKMTSAAEQTGAAAEMGEVKVSLAGLLMRHFGGKEAVDG